MRRFLVSFSKLLQKAWDAQSHIVSFGVLSTLMFDPKQPPAVLPPDLQPFNLENHLSQWSIQDRILFHKVMLRSMKNFRFVSKTTGKKMCDVLDYYYGFYKMSRDYSAFKTSAPRHSQDDVWCAVCQNSRAQIACDFCNETFHLKCLSPKMTEFPGEISWRCMFCNDLQKRKRKAGRKTRIKYNFQKKSIFEVDSADSHKLGPTNTSRGKPAPVSRLDVPAVIKPPSIQNPDSGAINAIPVDTNYAAKRTPAAVRSRLTKKVEDLRDLSKKVVDMQVAEPQAIASKLGIEPVKSQRALEQSIEDHNSQEAEMSEQDESSDDDSSEEDDQDAAKLGRPEYLSKKGDLAFFDDVSFYFPSPGTDHVTQEENDDPGIPWKIHVGDIVAFHMADANPPFAFRDVNYTTAPKDVMLKIWYPFEVPWSPAEVVSISWIPEGVDMKKFRQNKEKKVKANKKNYYSVKVDLDDVTLEVRWLYRCTEVRETLFGSLAKRPKSSPTKPSSNKFNSDAVFTAECGSCLDKHNKPVDEVWETDHIDEVDLATAIGPIQLVNSWGELHNSNPSPIASRVDPTHKMMPARLVCRKFFFVVKKQETDFPLFLGQNRLERSHNLSPRLRKTGYYRVAKAKKLKAERESIAMHP